MGDERQRKKTGEKKELFVQGNLWVLFHLVFSAAWATVVCSVWTPASVEWRFWPWNWRKENILSIIFITADLLRYHHFLFRTRDGHNFWQLVINYVSSLRHCGNIFKWKVWKKNILRKCVTWQTLCNGAHAFHHTLSDCCPLVGNDKMTLRLSQLRFKYVAKNSCFVDVTMEDTIFCFICLILNKHIVWHLGNVPLLL